MTRFVSGGLHLLAAGIAVSVSVGTLPSGLDVAAILFACALALGGKALAVVTEVRA